MTTTVKTKLSGHFAEARQWLLDYMVHVKFRNDLLENTLREDWSDVDKTRAAYVLGCVWGRLRQMDSDLEKAQVYGSLIQAELEPEPDVEVNGQGQT